MVNGLNADVSSRTEAASGPPERLVLRWRDDPAGMAAGAVLATIGFALGGLRYSHWWSTGLDLGLFDQGIWLLSQGRNPRLTIIDDNLFADHLSLVLVVFAPLYRVAATPAWLIGGQAAALGAAVPALRSLARQLGAEPRWATVATVGSAPLLAAAMFDFHPVVMTVPLVATALVAAHRDDVRTCTWMAVLVALVRADACILLLGVAVLARPHARRRLLLLAPVGMAIGALVPALLGSRQTFVRYWGHIGDSPIDAALHPWRIAEALLSTTALETALIWLLPVGFLTLARPRWALAATVAGMPLLLSSAGGTSVPWLHSAAALVPFTIGGALATLAEPRRLWEHPATLVVGVVAALCLTSPLSPRAPAPVRLDGVLVDRDVDGRDQAVAMVGPDEAVSADPYLLTRLSQRERAYMYPCPVLRIADATCGVPRTDPPPDVIVTSRDRATELRAAGWAPVTVPGGDLVVARPAPEGQR